LSSSATVISSSSGPPVADLRAGSVSCRLFVCCVVAVILIIRIVSSRRRRYLTVRIVSCRRASLYILCIAILIRVYYRCTNVSPLPVGGC
jgi:hypothetical protein